VNTKRKGSIALSIAISYFVNKASTVLLPIADCDKYDLAIDNGTGNIKKVQCKYSSDKHKSGAYLVDLRTFGGYRKKTYHLHYKEGDFDFLFVYCENGDKYLIPYQKVAGKSQLGVGVKSWVEFKC